VLPVVVYFCCLHRKPLKEAQMSNGSDRPRDAEEARSMRANDPDEVSSIPPERRERKVGRGQADLYSESDPDPQEDGAGRPQHQNEAGGEREG